MIVIYIMAAAAMFLLILLVILYMFRFETVNFTLSHKKINISDKDNLRTSPKISLRILHLSDFHLRKDRKGRHLFEFMQSLKSLEVDFIFITGDMVESESLFDHITEMLRGFKAKYGIFAVFGAHDYYNKKPIEFLRNMFKKKETYQRKNDTAQLINKLSNVGIEVLLNESKVIYGHEDFKKIELVGIDDPIIGKTDLAVALKNIEAAPVIKYFKDCSIDGQAEKLKADIFEARKEDVYQLHKSNSLRMALIHTPDSRALADLSLNNVDIVFAGHTHGGQIRLPKAGAIISGCNIKVKFASGLFYFKNFVLNISRGLGEGRYSPFRFYCQPEAILIEIIKS